MALPYTLLRHRPKQLGLIVLQADETLERDMWRLLPNDMELLVSRVPSGSTLTSESLRAMESVLTQSADLMPKGARFSVVGYGCTSGTAEIGAPRIADLIKAGAPTPHVTEPVSALIAACTSLGIGALGLVSPYVASVSDRLRMVLAEADIKVTGFASFEEPFEANVVRIHPDAIMAAAVEMGQSEDCNAVFLSCTNLRTLDLIEDIEQRIGKPAFSSNQVLAWHMVQLADPSATLRGPGALFRNALCQRGPC